MTLTRLTASLSAAGFVASALIAAPVHADPTQVRYRTQAIDNIEIFYREAGSPSAPTVLLLHGFPTSSHMFRELIPRLAQRYHVVAPDYPGYGFSSAPTPAAFSYTFHHLADIMSRFTQAIGLERYALYMQDFGGPVGFRMAVRHPERISALIVQNANAYEEGLSPAMDAARPAWEQRTPETERTLRGFLTLETTKFQYLRGARDPSRISPDAWLHAQAGLDRPGNDEIQLALLHDYGSNPKQYPLWQAYLREYRPPTLVVWGTNDPFFTAAGARAYVRDVPGSEIHLLETGHFALEEDSSTIADVMLDFLDRKLPKR
jgi:pimeloyl-ACP methyl ester carboxylesterase